MDSHLPLPPTFLLDPSLHYLPNLHRLVAAPLILPGMDLHPNLLLPHNLPSLLR